MKNFKTLRKEFIEDIKSNCTLYVHKSGAKIICVENEDTDRVFSLSFATKPTDNTGVFHILEHTVLCGSEKYPVHDPFNDMDKGSINTYLNAMTFYDKTVYPVASTNEKDFFNLMQVYCDAVFAPLIGEKKGIFLQEGVNFDGEKIGGVVYNEMKGVFAEPQEVLGFKIKEKLFEDNGYCFYSGGVPNNISELSYEKYLEVYKKYYKPSNCVIYIYGSIDVEKYMNFLDNRYLCKYEYEERFETYRTIKPFKQIVESTFYHDDEDTYMQVAFALGKAIDIKEMKALEILASVLMDTEASPLFNALRDAGLGNNIEYFIDDNMYQPSFNVTVSQSTEENTEKFRKVTEQTFLKLYENGIEHRLIEGAIQNQLFYIKEEDFGYKPKGLFYNFEILEYFLYGKEDFDGVKYSMLFDTDYDYRGLLKKYFIDNKSCVYAILKKGAVECRDTEGVFKKNTEELEKYQSTSDSEEDKAKIPYINVSDISRTNEKIETEIYSRDDAKIIYNRIEKDIIYFSVLFDTSFVPFELKKYIGIYTYLIGKLNTENYSAAEFDSDVNFYLGGFDVFYSSFAKKGGFFPAVVFDGKALAERTQKLIELMCEAMGRTLFNDSEKIMYLLKELKSRYEQNFIYRGNKYAVSRAMANVSEKSNYDEAVEGIGFYFNLCKVIKETEKRPEELKCCLEKVRDYTVQKRNIHISVVGQNKAAENAQALFLNFVANLERKSDEEFFLNVPFEGYQSEKIILNGNTCFNGKCFKFDTSGINMGHMILLNKIVNSDYLWKTVRSENGAYGSSSVLTRFGNVGLSSYRDNFIEKTYKAFDGIYDYIINNFPDERTLEKYKIGALSNMSKPIKNADKGCISVSRYFAEVTEEILDFERGSIMDAKCKDILMCADIFNVSYKKTYMCTLCGPQYNSGEGFFKHFIKI